MFTSKNLIKHYTPPTCTLEIYSNNFFESFNNNKIPDIFSFKLSFDDPRLPDEKRNIIQGDRHQLELLCKVVNDYINEFLQGKPVYFSYKLSKNEDNQEKNDIDIINQGLLMQELFYGYKKDNNQEITIKLSTLQLFDLANALDLYKLDLNNQEENNINPYKKLTWVSLIAIFLVSIGIGGIWWRNRLITSQTNENIVMIETEEKFDPLKEVIPPDSLPASNIPSVPPLQIPPELQNRATLPPPEPILTQAPNSEQAQQNINNNNQLLPPPQPIQPSTLKPPSPNVVMIPPPPKPPLPSPVSSTPSLDNAGDMMMINVKPKPKPSNNSKNADININSGKNPYVTPRLSSLPVLQSSSSSFPSTGINDGLSNSVSVIPENINQIPSSFDSNSSQSQTQSSTPKTNLTKDKVREKEVKQYFQKKWQPPESLKQSIEYRLIIDKEGSLQRVIPIGQASVTFLDRTGIPLMGDMIASSATENKQAIVRLILSPNGNVETFLE